MNVWDKVSEVKTDLHLCSPSSAYALLLDQEDETIFIDLRGYQEVQSWIGTSTNIPRGVLEALLRLESPFKKTDHIILYCESGRRSELTVHAMRELGYTNTYSLTGGFQSWKTSGLPVDSDVTRSKTVNIDKLKINHTIKEKDSCAPSQVLSIEAVEGIMLNRERPFILCDVREPEEYRLGHIPTSINCPLGLLEMNTDIIHAASDTLLVFVDGWGHRAPLACQNIAAYTKADCALISGGYASWKEQGMQITTSVNWSCQERERYIRHLSLPGVGEKGQTQLLNAKVLIVGLGGLGSPVALYLAAAGVGTLGLIDDDKVERSNLQRQIIHTESRLGMHKVESAREQLVSLNPSVSCDVYPARLSKENAVDIISGYDLVIDGGDNFETRYVINETCLALHIPWIHGSVYQFEGQVTLFTPGDGPCYRCLHHCPPPPELAPNCSQTGVLGVVPGIIGLWQANEALKLILNLGESLSGTLLHFDALSMNTRKMSIPRNPTCIDCKRSERHA